MKSKYMQIYEDIREKISSGFYHTNQRIPDGNSLGVYYEASPLTVKKALDILAREGLIVRRRGDGTFVKENYSNGITNQLSGTKNRQDIGEVESKIVHFEVMKAGDLAGKLSISAEDFIYKIIRLRIINGTPSIMEYTYMPINVIPGLQTKHLEDSIYDYITKELGLKIQSAHVKVKGIRPGELDKRFLNVSDTDFLMEVEQIVFLDDSKIFEYSLARHIPEEFNFETVVTRSF